MKKNIIIIAFLLSVEVVLGQSKSLLQTGRNDQYVAFEKFKGDTIGYLKYNFIDNKKKYLGKDLNTLLKDMEIPVKSYIPVESELNSDYIVYSYMLFKSFEESSYRIHYHMKEPRLIIKWLTPLSSDSVSWLRRINKTGWSKYELKYFGNKKIGDIMITY